MAEERGVERMQAEREFLENRYGDGERGEVEPHSLDHQDDEKFDYVQRPFGGAERIRGRHDINPETEGDLRTNVEAPMAAHAKEDTDFFHKTR